MKVNNTPQYKLGGILMRLTVKASKLVGNTITGLVEGAMEGARTEIKTKRKK